METTTYNRNLHFFALLTAAATLLLILAGGLVTSKGVGMAVPDWPNTFGYNMFFFPVSQWVGGVFYEHTHRLIGSLVGFMTLLLSFWLQGTRARPFLRWGSALLLVLALVTLFKWPSRLSDTLVLGVAGLVGLAASFVWPRSAPAPVWLRRLGLVALVAVIVQGVLGGMRVTQVMDELGIFHGALAQLFFVVMCSLALFTSAWWSRARESQPAIAKVSPVLTQSYLAVTVLIFLQLLIGATMRHQHAGLAVPDFPLAYGKLWPETTPTAIQKYNQQRIEVISVKPIRAVHVWLHMAHRVTAMVILAAVMTVAAATFRAPGDPPQRKLSAVWASLIGVQVLLGAWTVWSDKAADVATAHVLAGVLSLATGAILCIISFRQFSSGRNPAAEPTGFTGHSVLHPRPQ